MSRQLITGFTTSHRTRPDMNFNGYAHILLTLVISLEIIKLSSHFLNVFVIFHQEASYNDLTILLYFFSLCHIIIVFIVLYLL